MRWETTPDDIHGVIAAQGVLTAHGGMTSHAAVVARGMGKPCVAGAESMRIDLEARTVLIGERDLRRGRRDHARRLDRRGVRRRAAAGAAAGERRLPAGRDVGRRDPPARRAGQRRHAGGRHARPGVRRRGHRPLPQRAHVHGRGAAAGGARDDPRRLGRGARVGARPPRAHAAGRLRGHPPRDGRPARSPSGCSIRRCTSSCPTSPSRRSPSSGCAPPATPGWAPPRSCSAASAGCTSPNPMLGTRGCRVGLLYPEIYAMQVRAIARATRAVRSAGGDPRPTIMIPLVGFADRARAHARAGGRGAGGGGRRPRSRSAP